MGILNVLPMACWVAGVALAGLGHFEPAAVLFGAIKDTKSIGRPSSWFVETTASTDAALLAGLGEDRLAALRDRGAALEPAEAVAYLRPKPTVCSATSQHLDRDTARFRALRVPYRERFACRAGRLT